MANIHGQENSAQVLMTFYEDQIHLETSFSFLSNRNLKGTCAYLFLKYVKINCYWVTSRTPTPCSTLLQAPTSHYICTTVVPFMLSMGTSNIIKVQVLDYQVIRLTPFIIWDFIRYRHLLPNVVHPKVRLMYLALF